MTGFTFTDEDIETVVSQTPDPGVYEAEVDTVSWMANGSLMLKFKSAETGDRLCNDFLSFTEKAKPYSARKLKQLGLEKVDDKYELSEDGQELVGKRVTLTLIVDDNPKYLTPDFSSPNHGYLAEDTTDLPF